MRHTRNFRLGWLLVVMLAFSVPAGAQPGGGGGLRIARFYDRQGTALNLADRRLRMRCFVLRDSVAVEEIFLQDGFAGRPQDWNWIELKTPVPFANYDSDGFLRGNQRLLIAFGADTMIIDFFGIPGENPVGERDNIDSVVILPGHFRYFLLKNGWAKSPSILDAAPDTTRPGALIRYRRQVDAGFLREKSWGSEFLLSHARHELMHKRYASAVELVEKAIARAHGDRNCAALRIRAAAQANLGRYDEAFEASSEGFFCPFNQGEDYGSRLYRTLELARKSADPGRALRILDFVLRSAGATRSYQSGTTEYVYGYRPSVRPVYERAENFAWAKLDKPRAIQTMQALLDSIPREYLGELADGKSFYGELYFELAAWEYETGNRSAANRHWLLGMEFRYEMYESTTARVKHFDTLMRFDGTPAELYIARALAKFQIRELLPDSTALLDLDTAQLRDPKDFRVEMYRAKIFFERGELTAARAAIDRAIAKASGDPRPYLLRYQIRHPDKKRRYDLYSDPDLIRYSELADRWDHRRYFH